MKRVPGCCVNLLSGSRGLRRKIHAFANANAIKQIQEDRSRRHLTEKPAISKNTRKKKVKSGSVLEKTNSERVSLLDWNADFEAVWDIPSDGNFTEDSQLRPWSKGFRTLWTVFHETGAFDYPLSQKIVWFLNENQTEPLIMKGKNIKACQMFRGFEMRQKCGCNPETAALNTFLHVICQSGETGQAEAILRRVEFKLKPNKMSFGIIIDGWCKLGEVNRALRVFGWMSALKLVDVVACNSVLDAMCRANEFGRANVFLKKMPELGCEPDIVTCNILIHGLCKANKVEMALKVYDSMLKHGSVAPDEATYVVLVQSLCSVGKVEHARQLFDKMRREGFRLRVQVYASFIKFYCNNRQELAALRLVREMNLSGCQLTSETYEFLEIRIYITIWRRGGKLWEEMRSESWDGATDVYSFLIRAFCRLMDLKGAFHLLEEMINKRMVPQRYTWDMFCTKCWKAGEGDRVYRLNVMRWRTRFMLRLQGT